MVVTDKQIQAEFGEVVAYSWPGHRQDVEIFHAQIVRKTFAPHVHDGYIIGFVKRGGERFRYRGAEWTAGPGDLILLSPDEVHTAEAAQDDGVEYSTILVSTETVHKSLDTNVNLSSPLIRAPEIVATLQSVVQNLSAHNDPLTYDSFIEFTVLNVLCRFGGVKALEKKHTSIGIKISDITDYVDANLDQPLKVENLAEVANFSRFHFIRSFRNLTGVTPIAFVQARRAMKAKQLLAAGHCSSIVAVQTGFADQSHMNRWLKACYGTTSKMFKKAI